MSMIVWLLVVIAHINGAPAIATHKFSSEQVCQAIANDFKRLPEVAVAKCIPETVI